MVRVLAWRNGDRISPMSVQTVQDAAAAFESVLAALTHFLGSPVLGAVVRAGIPDRLDTGPMRAEELAQVTGLHPLSTTRVLHILASFGVFRQVDPGVFANTEASKLPRNRPGGLRNLVWDDTTDKHLRAVASLGPSVRTGESTFVQVTGQSFLDYLRADPEGAATYNAMFAELQGGEQLAIADTIDWPTTAAVADIGGGNGSLLARFWKRDRTCAACCSIPRMAFSSRTSTCGLAASVTDVNWWLRASLIRWRSRPTCGYTRKFFTTGATPSVERS